MAGSPLKRARREAAHAAANAEQGLITRAGIGFALVECGDRMVPVPLPIDAASLARDLPSTEQLHREALATLRHLATGAVDERNRVSAAKALAELTAPQPKTINVSVSDTYEAMPTEQLEAMRAKAIEQ